MEEREALKRDTGMFAGGLLLYSFLMYICYDGYLVVRCAIGGVAGQGSATAEAVGYIKKIAETSGVPYLVSVTAGVFLLGKFYQDMQQEGLFIKQKKMGAKAFLQILCVFMGMQVLFDLWGGTLDAMLEPFGLSVREEIASASEPSTTLSMLLYTSLFAPVTEEIIFRGFILKGLKRYGKCIAIVISAVFFGVFHANLVQSVFAFGIGLVLGYVAMEYSILWSIVLHVINNFLFSEMASILTKQMSPLLKASLMNGIEIGFFVCGILVLILHWKQIRQYVWENRSLRCLEAFTNSWVIVYFGLNLLTACVGITRR